MNEAESISATSSCLAAILLRISDEKRTTDVLNVEGCEAVRDAFGTKVVVITSPSGSKALHRGGRV